MSLLFVNKAHLLKKKQTENLFKNCFFGMEMMSFLPVQSVYAEN